MYEENLKRYNYIKFARKNRVQWTLCCFLLLVVLFIAFIYIVKSLSFGYVLLSILVLVLFYSLIISFYLYIQFFAKCYRCKYCKHKFLDSIILGFYKELNFTRIKEGRIRLANYYSSTKGETYILNNWIFRKLVIQCPYCMKKMICLETQTNFDEDYN